MTSVANNSGNGGEGSKPNVGLIAGVAVGAVVALTALWIIIFLIRRRRRVAKPTNETSKEKPAMSPTTHGAYSVPYSFPTGETSGLLSSAERSPVMIPVVRDNRTGAGATRLLNPGLKSSDVDSSKVNSAPMISADPLMCFGHPRNIQHPRFDKAVASCEYSVKSLPHH